MEYRVRFLPVGERNLQPPEADSKKFYTENADSDKTRLDILWEQLSNSASPKKLLKKAVLLIAKGGENEHR